MDRRSLLKLFGSAPLAALPEIKSIEIARVAPEDVILIQSDDHLSREQCQRLIETAKAAFPPGQKVLVVEGGLTLSVIRKADG